MSDSSTSTSTAPNTKTKPYNEPIPESIWQQAQALKLAGMSWPDIGKELGVNQSTLKGRWHRAGMPRVQEKLNEAKNTFSPERKVQIASQTIDDISRKVRDLLASDSLATAERLKNYDPQDVREEQLREQVAHSLVKRSSIVLGWESQQSNVQVSVIGLAVLQDRDEQVEEKRAEAIDV